MSHEIMRDLAAARAKPRNRKNRMRVHAGDKVFPVIDNWKGGFAVARDDCPLLRGFVELYDGARHVASCLVICAQDDGDLRRYEYKRVTPAQDDNPKDFAEDPFAPSALIEGPKPD